LLNAIKGYYRVQERQMQLSWDQVRFATFHNVNIQLQRKDKLKSYTDLVRFPWEPEPVKVKLTPDALKSLVKKK
jgi:hypothetical protein